MEAVKQAEEKSASVNDSAAGLQVRCGLLQRVTFIGAVVMMYCHHHQFLIFPSMLLKCTFLLTPVW